MHSRTSWLVALLIALVPLTTARTAHADRVDDLIALLSRAPIFKVRAQAALALGTQRRAATRTVGPLSTALRDRHRAVRAAAALALGNLGAVESLSALSDAMSDEDMTVARAAKRSLERVVKAFASNRGRFQDRRWHFFVQGLRTEARFKDLVIEALMGYDNIEIGASASFDDEEAEGAAEPAPAVQLDLSGEIVNITGSKATLQLTLSLREGGYVVTRWERIVARGATRDDVLANTANIAVRRVLAYLGARRR